MTPPRIAHVLMTADTVGGVWTYALELARGLAEHGVSVSLATMGERLTAAQQEEARSLANLHVLESTYKLEWMEGPWSDVRRAGKWLLRLEQRIRPDVVHLNGYTHGALPWKAPVMIAAHSCVMSWWRAVFGREAGGEYATYRDSVARGLRAVHSIVAPSAAMLEALYLNYGPIPAGRVIPNGRSSSLFFRGNKEPFILTAGRLWDRAKNVKLLDDIASDIPWPIRIAGEPQAPGSRCAERFSNLEKLGRLPQRDISEIYAKASIYAAPAKYEPFGLSILEAAMSGCALVLGDIPSLRETWGNAAVYVDPNSRLELRKALMELIDFPQLRDGLADRARRRSLHYSRERMAASYLQVYRQLKAWKSIPAAPSKSEGIFKSGLQTEG